VDIELSPLLDDAYLARLASGQRTDRAAVLAAYGNRLRRLLSSRRYDVLWIQYELFPYLPGMFESLVSMTGRPIVLDYDDAIFHGYDRHSSPLVRGALGNKLAPLIRRAEVCICGNGYLASYAARFSDRVAVVPTVVNTDQYAPAVRDPADAPVVGWIGSPSTWSAHLLPRVPDILSVCREADARLRVVGGGPGSDLEGIESLGWREDREISAIQGMDIGIMPLPDDHWARGKCGYKIIQYLACGLPAIASPVGVNSEIIEHGVNGFLASTEKEWRDALRTLLASPERRGEMGRLGRARIVKRYSMASQQHRILKLLQVAAARQGAAAVAEV
ncbi:MAG: glycosyltransferase, partial [Hyphomicrobiales bacterium]